MTHRSILTSIWTSVLAVLMAVLSGFGFAVKSAPAAASAPAAEGTAGTEATAVRRPVAARRSWRAMMRGGSLPPTIKQRIRAEAHGKTPSVRRSTTAAAMGAGTGTTSRPLTSAAVSAPAASHTVPAAATGAARDGLALAA
ncbi:DUF6344 domain-containing protein [Streptomyces sp. NPDC089795]|uniref:DUF6344 domain-containing protein n=1 Tax=Streptomyces sp. NPDC089795 TaxID=3155297 RepID=UPI0034488E6A